MAIAMQRFCINRKIAPALSIEAFFRLVNRLGLNKGRAAQRFTQAGKVTVRSEPSAGARAGLARYHIRS